MIPPCVSLSHTSEDNKSGRRVLINVRCYASDAAELLAHRRDLLFFFSFFLFAPEFGLLIKHLKDWVQVLGLVVFNPYFGVYFLTLLQSNFDVFFTHLQSDHYRHTVAMERGKEENYLTKGYRMNRK